MRLRTSLDATGCLVRQHERRGESWCCCGVDEGRANCQGKLTRCSVAVAAAKAHFKMRGTIPHDPLHRPVAKPFDNGGSWQKASCHVAKAFRNRKTPPWRGFRRLSPNLFRRFFASGAWQKRALEAQNRAAPSSPAREPWLYKSASQWARRRYNRKSGHRC